VKPVVVEVHPTCDHRPVCLDVDDLAGRACIRVSCQRCGFLLGLGDTSDPVGREFGLAIVISDICQLWQPGRERDKRIGWAVEAFAS
jgi:hypothetical protein